MEINETEKKAIFDFAKEKNMETIESTHGVIGLKHVNSEIPDDIVMISADDEHPGKYAVAIAYDAKIAEYSNDKEFAWVIDWLKKLSESDPQLVY